MKNSTIGTTFEPFITLMADVEQLKRQMDVITTAFAELTKLARHYRPRNSERTYNDDASKKDARAGKKYPVLAASSALNVRLRNMPRRDPLRVQTEKIRKEKGHIVALDYFKQHVSGERRLPIAARRSRSK